MNFLENAILNEGRILPGDILKVDSFLNHQLDVEILEKIGDDLYFRFKDSNVNKILTIETSGIAIACFAARKFGCRVVYAKKSKSSNISESVYSSLAHSYTHGNTNTVIVSKEYLSKDDNVLIVDDFLATGEAINALIDICSKAGAGVAGAGIAIEKVYQGGGNALREKGFRIESVAKVHSMSDDGKIVFEK